MPIWQRMMFAHAAARPPSETVVAFGDNSSPFLAVYKGATMTKLTAPASLPSTVVHCTAINRVNSHVAVTLEGKANTANLMIYDTSGTQLVLLNTINVPGQPNKSGVAYSPDGKWLAVSSSTSPFLYVYDVLNSYALISASVSTPTTTAGLALTWVNGRIMFGKMNGTASGLSMFSIDARPGYTYVQDIGIPSNLALNKMRASRDGKKLAAIAGGGNIFYWSDIDTTAYTFGTARTLTLSGPDDLHFNFDGTRLGVSLSGTPFILQYDSTSLTTWSTITAPASLPSARPFGIAPDPSETGFILGGSTSGVLLRYSFANVKGTNIAAGPGFCYYGSAEKVN